MRILLLAGLVATSACAPCSSSNFLPQLTLSRMQEQPRADLLEPSAFFADGAVVRVPPAGTVPWRRAPRRPPLTAALLDEGQRAFDATCAACHGRLGDGESAVARLMRVVPPRDLMIDRLRAASPEYIYDRITRGFGLMRPYAASLTEEERWAVAWYVKALQLSRHATVDELPASLRSRLEGAP